MEQPRWLFSSRPRSARAQQCAARLNDFRLHEKLAECWVCLVSSCGVKSYFSESGKFDEALFAGLVGERDAAHFHVVLGGDTDLRVSVDVIDARAKFRPTLAEDGFITGRNLEQRL